MTALYIASSEQIGVIIRLLLYYPSCQRETVMLEIDSTIGTNWLLAQRLIQFL